MTIHLILLLNVDCVSSIIVHLASEDNSDKDTILMTNQCPIYLIYNLSHKDCIKSQLFHSVSQLCFLLELLFIIHICNFTCSLSSNDLICIRHLKTMINSQSWSIRLHWIYWSIPSSTFLTYIPDIQNTPSSSDIFWELLYFHKYYNQIIINMIDTLICWKYKLKFPRFIPLTRFKYNVCQTTLISLYRTQEG